MSIPAQPKPSSIAKPSALGAKKGKNRGNGYNAANHDRNTAINRLRPSVEADLRNNATSEQTKLLNRRENLFTWLLTLERIKSETQNHIRNHHVNLASIPEVLDNGEVNPEYTKRKAEVLTKTNNREFFIECVKARIQDVTLLIDEQNVNVDTVSFAKGLNRILHKLENGHIDDAKRSIESLMDALTGDHLAD